jgi:hypothetical protein
VGQSGRGVQSGSSFADGHNPELRIFCISYGAQLAEEHADQFKAIVQSDWLCIFPRMRIKRVVENDVYTMWGFCRVSAVCLCESSRFCDDVRRDLVMAGCYRF